MYELKLQKFSYLTYFKHSPFTPPPTHTQAHINSDTHTHKYTQPHTPPLTHTQRQKTRRLRKNKLESRSCVRQSSEENISWRISIRRIGGEGGGSSHFNSLLLHITGLCQPALSLQLFFWSLSPQEGGGGGYRMFEALTKLCWNSLVITLRNIGAVFFNKSPLVNGLVICVGC